MTSADSTVPTLVSIIVPARNEAGRIGTTVRAAIASKPSYTRVEVIVVDDGSTDDTTREAKAAGARVLLREDAGESGGTRRGNPAAARNAGAAAAQGDPLVFLDADCVADRDWLTRLLQAHSTGYEVIGGSLELPGGLDLTARADHFASAYHVHPRRPAGLVPNHPPCNLSVRRDAFERTVGFWERHPAADGHEELAWQHELRESGGRIFFEPAAIVEHHHRSGWGNLLRRSYRWAYSAVDAKATWGTVRFPWLYRSRGLLLLLSLPLALVSTIYVLGCWWRVGRIGAILYLPAILASRIAYAFGMLAGGLRRTSGGTDRPQEHRPRWG